MKAHCHRKPLSDVLLLAAHIDKYEPFSYQERGPAFQLLFCVQLFWD